MSEGTEVKVYVKGGKIHEEGHKYFKNVYTKKEAEEKLKAYGTILQAGKDKVKFNRNEIGRLNKDIAEVKKRMENFKAKLSQL